MRSGNPSGLLNAERILIFIRIWGCLLLISGLLQSQALRAWPGEEASYSGVYFVGHMTPDSDSIGAAIGAAELFDGVAARQGDINPESEFFLNYFGAQAPVLVDHFGGKQVFLLDHNQKIQSREDLRDVVGIIDHHALRASPLVSSKPIWIDIRPWGSSCSIIAWHYRRLGKEPSKASAGALLSGILSDTLLFTSPTTTSHDKELAAWLASIAEVEDINRYGNMLFVARSSLDQKSVRQLVLLDFKEYEIEGAKLGFGTIETLDIESVSNRTAELLLEMARLKEERGYDYIFLTIVSIYGNNSVMLLSSPAEQALASLAYGVDAQSEQLNLPGLVSRKLQFIPALQNALASRNEVNAVQLQD